VEILDYEIIPLSLKSYFNKKYIVSLRPTFLLNEVAISFYKRVPWFDVDHYFDHNYPLCYFGGPNDVFELITIIVKLIGVVVGDYP